MRIAMWFQRHRTIAHWLVKVPAIRNEVSRRVWAHLDADPTFREGMAQSKADFEAHRTYVWDLDTGLVSPDPEWPKDGPQPKPAYFMERRP